MPSVIFGISGSIAAFRALEVIRLLVTDGIEVLPVVSRGGAKFVTRSSVEALAGKRAIYDIFPENDQQEIEHIALSRKADLLVTCPASADIIAKYAIGIADDPLALVALAFGNPHIIAPAMNSRMWENPATKSNVEILKERGFVFAGPDKGLMACGDEGWGRLTSIENIYGHIRAELGRAGPLAGKHVLVTAGATRENIDEVRFLTNRSSGRMGHAVAEAARDLGATVDLVTASELEPPAVVNVVNVVSADEMLEEVLKLSERADAIIMAAAVADFKPVDMIKGKIKKGSGSDSMDLNLLRTPDVLSELGERKHGSQVLVGFAAEHGSDGGKEALRKCREKMCDLICLNDISRTDIGFSSEFNELTIIKPDGSEKRIPKGSKREVGKAVMMEVAGLLNEHGKPAGSAG